MSRLLPLCAIVLILAGCRLPPDMAPLRPLPEDGTLFPYQDIVARARAQASAAVEAFYEDNWTDVEESAKGLEQTACFLPKTIEQPPQMKSTLIEKSVALGKDAAKLIDTAKLRDIQATTELLRRITLQVRSLQVVEKK